LKVGFAEKNGNRNSCCPFCQKNNDEGLFSSVNH